MKKKFLVPAIMLILVVLLVILFAVLLPSHQSGDDAPTMPNLYPRPENPTAPTQSAPPTEDQVLSDFPTADPLTPTTPSESTATLPPEIPAIPDDTIVSEAGDLVIVYHNQFDLDVYLYGRSDGFLDRKMGNRVGETIYIGLLSKTPNKLNRLQVDIPGTSLENVHITPESFLRNEQHIVVGVIDGMGAVLAQSDLPLAETSVPVALTLAGIDWNEALERYTTMVHADEVFWRSPTTPGNLQILRDAQAAYADYIRQYQNLAQDLAQTAPKFEAVLVEIDLSQVAVGTVIDTAVLRLDGETYTLPLGEIRIRAPREEAPGSFGSSGPGYEYFDQYRLAALTPWDDGNCTAILDFSATQKMVLNRIEVLTDNGTVATGAWIRQIKHQDWARTIEEGLPGDFVTMRLQDKKRFPDKDPLYWDGKSPFFVNAGDRLCMDISFHDPAAQGTYYHGAVYYALHYTTAQGDAVILAEAELRQPNFNWVELYYTYLENLDLSAYYHFLNQGGELPE